MIFKFTIYSRSYKMTLVYSLNDWLISDDEYHMIIYNNNIIISKVDTKES